MSEVHCCVGKTVHQHKPHKLSCNRTVNNQNEKVQNEHRGKCSLMLLDLANVGSLYDTMQLHSIWVRLWFLSVNAVYLEADTTFAVFRNCQLWLCACVHESIGEGESEWLYVHEHEPVCVWAYGALRLADVWKKWKRRDWDASIEKEKRRRRAVQWRTSGAKGGALK